MPGRVSPCEYLSQISLASLSLARSRIVNTIVCAARVFVRRWVFDPHSRAFRTLFQALLWGRFSSLTLKACLSPLPSLETYHSQHFHRPATHSLPRGNPLRDSTVSVHHWQLFETGKLLIRVRLKIAYFSNVQRRSWTEVVVGHNTVTRVTTSQLAMPSQAQSMRALVPRENHWLAITQLRQALNSLATHQRSISGSTRNLSSSVSSNGG